MARVTIIGAGVTGMTIAAALSRNYEVTVVARNLPGDEPSQEWASPWAGAVYLAGPCSTSQGKQMRADAFAEWWRLSATHPESSIRRITVEDFFNDVSEEDIYWKEFVPDFHLLPKDQLPPAATLGVTYTSVVLNPTTFLPWYRNRLESQGVRFMRMELKSLSDAQILGHDVLINATGVGARDLSDVNDQDVMSVRGQTMIVKSDRKKAFKFDTGDEYTYALPRGDGTMIIGGIRQHGSTNTEVEESIQHDIVQRLHKNFPNDFSSSLADYQIVGNNVGFRPGRTSGLRIESEVKNGQKIVHAYGAAGEGYILSFGTARVVSQLVDDILFPTVPAKL